MIESTNWIFDCRHHPLFGIVFGSCYVFPETTVPKMARCRRLLGASELQSKSGRSGGGISGIFVHVFARFFGTSTSRKESFSFFSGPWQFLRIESGSINKMMECRPTKNQ